ncbi:hypothetical protein UlMin_005205 [Ulmus minor]
MAQTLFLTIFFLLLVTQTLSKTLCNPKDKQVLLQIKKAFNNPYVLTSWNPSDDCCTWYCVTCDPKTHRINSLTVSGGLSGQIPPQIGDLPHLVGLTLRKNENLTGPIPPAIVKLRKLRYLVLDWNSLTGPVPDFLSQMQTLTYFTLSFNKLTGSIPSSLSNLTNLEAIHLDRNQLTGSIPESFGHFKKMDFGTIDLSRNKLVGDGSMLFGSKKTTQFVDLSRNLLEFDLSKVEFSKSLTWIDLNHNKIWGKLPAGLAAFEYFQVFNVSYNSLCGKIPVGGYLQKLDDKSFFQNRCLCGAPLAPCKK